VNQILLSLANGTPPLQYLRK